jgi:hypothetical protein
MVFLYLTNTFYFFSSRLVVVEFYSFLISVMLAHRLMFILIQIPIFITTFISEYSFRRCGSKSQKWQRQWQHYVREPQ